MIKVTLTTVKKDIKDDPGLANAPKTILQAALRSFMNHVKENPESFHITPKSEEAIHKYIDGLTKHETGSDRKEETVT